MAIMLLGMTLWSPLVGIAVDRAPARAVMIAANGRGAVLEGADGALALLLPLADGWVARRVPDGAPVALDGGRIVVTLGEPMLARAELMLSAPVAGWLEARAR
jgi:hypothetical protein